MMDRDPRSIQVDELGIHQRTIRILRYLELKTVADILLFGRARLLNTPNAGPVTADDIARAIPRRSASASGLTQTSK